MRTGASPDSSWVVQQWNQGTVPLFQQWNQGTVPLFRLSNNKQRKALHDGSDADLFCVFSAIVKGFSNKKGEYEIK